MLIFAKQEISVGGVKIPFYLPLAKGYAFLNILNECCIYLMAYLLLSS
jgi:hypothetical protein